MVTGPYTAEQTSSRRIRTGANWYCFTNTSMRTTEQGSEQPPDRWTGLSAVFLNLFGRLEARDNELERGQLGERLVREQVGGHNRAGGEKRGR